MNDGGGDAPPTSEAGTDGSPGSVELPEGTVILTLNEEGNHVGMGVADHGMVHFYSEELEAYWSVQLSEDDVTAPPSEPLEVRVLVDETRAVTYSVFDPTGRLAPIFFGSDLPEAGSYNIDVDSMALLEMDEPFFSSDPMASNPFDELFFVPVAVWTLVGAVLIRVAIGEAMTVIKSFVVGVCEALMPLHRETCRWVGRGVDVASLFIAPRAYAKVSNFAHLVPVPGPSPTFVIDTAAHIAGMLCGELGMAIEDTIQDRETDAAEARSLQFREVLTYYNYLLWRIGENPPEDPELAAALESRLQALLPQLLLVGPSIRHEYVYLHHPSLFPSYGELGATGLSAAIGEYFTNPAGQPVGATLTLMARGLRIVGSSVVQNTIRIADGAGGRAGLAALAGCTITIVKSVFFTEPGASLPPGPPPTCGDNRTDDMSSGQCNDDGVCCADPDILLTEEVQFMHRELIDMHRAAFGGAEPPALTCLADVFEPNGSWRIAHGRPHPGPVGMDGRREPLGLGSSLTTEALTLCGIGDMPVDEDWYAFPVGAISWRAEAKIFEPPGDGTTDCDGCRYDPDERVCMDMYWYSQANDLAGTPPVRLRGACGPVNSEFSIGPVGVAGTAGETFRQILINVYPEDRSSTVPVRYSLGFTP